MSDRIKQELEELKVRRETIWNDLRTYGSKLSAPAQVVLIAEIARLDIEIKQIVREIEALEFEELIRNSWEGGDGSKF